MTTEAAAKAMDILAIEADEKFFKFVEKAMDNGAFWYFEGEDAIILRYEDSEAIIVSEEDRDFEVHPTFEEASGF